MRLLAIAVLALAAQAAPQSRSGIDVQATIAPDSVRVGEVLTLTVSVSGVSDDAEVSFPELPDTGTVTALGPPQVLGDTPPGLRTARYRLAAWDVGDLILPEADVRIVTAVAELAVPMPELSVRVSSMIPIDANPDTLAWQPPADVMGGNWSMRDKLAVTGLLLALLIGTLVAVRRGGIVSPVPVPAGTPPRERALAALARLQEAQLAEVGEFKGYYSALSQIVREFLADNDARWGLDLTTPELVAAVGGQKLEPDDVLALGQLLVGADLVKFARSRPTLDEAAASMESARRWVEAFELAEDEPEQATEVIAPSEARDQDEWNDAMTVLEELFTGDEFTVDARAFSEDEASTENGNDREHSGS